jgi:hypothetical protein
MVGIGISTQRPSPAKPEPKDRLENPKPEIRPAATVRQRGENPKQIQNHGKSKLRKMKIRMNQDFGRGFWHGPRLMGLRG